MAIVNGQVANATEVMNAMGSIWADSMNGIFASDYTGFNSRLGGDGDVKLDNTIYGITTDFNTKLTTNTDYDGVDRILFGGFTVFDIFSGDSVDTDIWAETSGTGSSATVSGGKLTMYSATSTNDSSSQLISSGGSAFDLNATCALIIDLESLSYTNGGGSGAASGAAIIYLTDGANDVMLLGGSGIGSLTENYYRFEIDPSTNNVERYSTSDDINGTGSSSSIDVTTLTDGSAWRLKLYTNGVYDNGDRGLGSIVINSIRYIEDATTETSIFQTDFTTTETVTNCIPLVTLALPTGISIGTLQVSADGGSNWETATNKEIHRFTNTGTSLGLKVTLNSSLTMTASILGEFAIKYNLY